jgi:hypothetical protein
VREIDKSPGGEEIDKSPVGEEVQMNFGKSEDVQISRRKKVSKSTEIIKVTKLTAVPEGNFNI